jgi:hypothetical protein
MHKNFRFLAMPSIEVTNLLFAGDEVEWVTWKYVENEENMLVRRHTNEVLEAYVTTGARLKLHVPESIKGVPSTVIQIPSSTFRSVGSHRP